MSGRMKDYYEDKPLPNCNRQLLALLNIAIELEEICYNFSYKTEILPIREKVQEMIRKNSLLVERIRKYEKLWMQK